MVMDGIFYLVVGGFLVVIFERVLRIEEDVIFVSHNDMLSSIYQMFSKSLNKKCIPNSFYTTLNHNVVQS